MSDDPVIGVVGLGRLGLCLAAVLSVDGDYEVWGADRSEEVVTAVTNGIAPNAWEPGLSNLVSQWADVFDGTNEIATTDTAAMAARCDVVFVVTPTPSLPSGEFDDTMVREAVAEVCGGFLLRDRPGRPVIVITSTLQPGSADSIAVQMSGASPDVDAALVVSPAFIALGSVVTDLRYPDTWLIGTDDDNAAEILSAIYRRMSPRTDSRVMSRINVELAKLAVNVNLSTRIGFANGVARVCEQFVGADASVVLEAVGSDSRIGHGFMRHGGTPSGPCLPRDLRAWQTMNGGERWADSAGVARQAATDVVEWIMDHVQEALSRRENDEVRGYADVAVINLCYKPNTPIVDDSLGMAVCAALAYERVDYCAYDDLVCPDLEAWADRAQALTCPVIICCDETPQVMAVANGTTIVDIWGSVSVPSDRQNVRVIRPGVHPSSW